MDRYGALFRLILLASSFGSDKKVIVRLRFCNICFYLDECDPLRYALNTG
jgi:hypothetical protein